MKKNYSRTSVCLDKLRLLVVVLGLALSFNHSTQAQCVNFIANGSMEDYTNCPNLSNSGTITYATNWKTTGGIRGGSGQLMVYKPDTCVSNKAVSAWPASSALTAGSHGTNWLGGHHTEDWQNTLLTPLPAGTYTLYLDAGNVIGPYLARTTTLQFYGLKSTDPDFAKIPAQLLGTVTVDNAISATDQTWVTRSFQVTTTEVYDRIEIVNVTPGATGVNIQTAAYTYIDNFKLSYPLDAGPDQTVCFGENVTMAATGDGTWSTGPANTGTATITDAASAATTITNFSAPGTYTFIRTLNGCTDTVAITVTDCCNSNAGTITIIP